MDNVIHGHCDAPFGKVRAALADNIASGDEVGASIAIDIDGEAVVDIWSGFRDAARTSAWTRDTIVNVWSSTRTVTSLAALMLVDRGLGWLGRVDGGDVSRPPHHHHLRHAPTS
jgi:CubicO group peptidase (beta-lactamase class C family)